ncbi:tubulin folding cofactor D C terminal-domain-containing protein [Coniochaeta sp. 2T2.1]|nr:tubulin folding cofactor D C terminal-domain-containing protein [Coniochaeta sp. 2T2.1]
MDAPEEESDVKLQLASHEFIADFDRSLVLYLRKQDASGGGTSLRSRVRVRETTRLISLLDPFQELPQLLDQHLPKWLPLLSESFLEYLVSRKRSRAARSTRSDLLMPLSTGICKILYTFCKIRGEKVIVRFLNNETKYLELLVTALEECERNAAGPDSLQWSWEERYVVLLWLSLLLMAPFDLATISSADVDEEDLPSIPGLRWPAKLPGITVRVLPLAIKYLASPGKERDAAKALLVRIAMRKDMQALGVLDALVQWSLQALRPGKDDESKTPYYYIGVLSFLAGILAASSDTSDMVKYLNTIFNTVYQTSSSDSSPITASALARKTMIKVIRSITILILRQQHLSPNQMADTELVETTIGYLLESLADNDTPVRLAASKSLSMITLKLDVDMASQVVEAVIESLGRNVLWSRPTPTSPRVRDLSAVNPSEWHGLMMTLSHLLYRRSPPAENLNDIINALLMGLSFEQRSSSGGSIGTNVRDAACFGVWALARRYTTKELLAVPTEKTVSPAARNYASPPSILQILASELIIAGSLDSAGNIRRGSSAALQELVGRHPDCVTEGIRVVQTVDYHAVALRTRAIGQVALEATKVYGLYGEAVLDALLTWRGIGDPDVAARRAAAGSFGTVNAELAREGNAWGRLREAVRIVMGRMKGLAARQVEERHGLILALAAVLNYLPSFVEGRVNPGEEAGLFISEALAAMEEIMVDCKEKKYRRPELVAEAAGQLVVSSLPLLQAAALGLEQGSVSLSPGSVLVETNGQTITDVVSTIDRAGEPGRARLQKLIPMVHDNLREWLKRSEEENITVAARAGLVLLCFCEPALREEIIKGWALSVSEVPKGNRAGSGTSGGYFAALSMAYPITATFQNQEQAREDRTLICRTIQERWAGDKDIDTRVAILKSLTGTEVLKQNAVELLSVIEEGLDDYTTNARGDVGSLVRLQAIRATKSVWQALKDQASDKHGLSHEVAKLFPRILRLAAEKLDRVRVEAQATLALALTEDSSSHLSKLTFSSTTYFRFLLDLLSSSPSPSHPTPNPTFRSQTSSPAQQQACLSSLLAGYVTSADTGNEDLVISSRAALTSFCSSSTPNSTAVTSALVDNLRSYAGVDRVIVPTLEVIAFLFHVGLFGSAGYNYKSLCLLVQKAGYRSGNVRKIEACVRVYGAVGALEGQTTGEKGQEEGVREARKRLAALLLHPWPRVRSVVVDELWGLLVVSEAGKKKGEKLMGVDWGKADRGAVKGLVEELGLA